MLQARDLDDHACHSRSEGRLTLGVLALLGIRHLSQDEVDVGVDELADQLALGGLINGVELGALEQGSDGLLVVLADVVLSS